ncbi:hypothetical protein ABEB36_015358 [Hypothenemus hampei]|uniref:Cytochrome b5 heme-binding domain-containing protein n=1 Tax=Hypothenemus hampei TaxID=57062 RepID=A0ABD1E0A5_HYPHA
MFKALALLGLLVVLLGLYLNDLFQSLGYILNSNMNKSTSRYFTSEELATYNGVKSPFLYLAILGIVFNVTKGEKHYGLGQQYHFFVGKDASRNFITGNFNDQAKSDDVTGFSEQELRSLNNWFKFYLKEYSKVGMLIGRYYDELGNLTPYGRQIKKLIQAAEQKNQDMEREKLKFPPCNVEWDRERGSRVWCSNKSGGIDRAWVGKPRQYYESGSKNYRCACISDENLSMKNILQYPDCDSMAESCYVTN